MTPALWLILAVVVSFCIYTVAVFLAPDDDEEVER